MKVERDNISDVPNLQCEHEEAGNRIILYINDAVRAGYEKIIIASSDTDVFVTALYLTFRYTRDGCISVFKNCG